MDALEMLVAKDEIRDLQSRYMRGLDRLDAELNRATFWEDATTDYGIFKGGRDDFVDFAQTILADHRANLHLIGQSLIEVEGDVAFGEVYYYAFHRVMLEDVPQDMIIAGRYIDRYERRGGQWRIAHRSEMMDWVRREPAADGFLADLKGALICGRMDDRSYQRDWLRTA